MNLTIGKLKKYLEKYNPPDDALILIERVEDIYFKKHGWKTIDKPHSFMEGEITEYIEAFCAVKFKEDNNLYINCHY